jgi:hypothetical protein
MKNKDLELRNFLEKVENEMKLANVFYKKAKFSCFSDGIFTYSYSNHTTLFEFNIIADDMFFDKMTIKELLEVKRIGYFDNGIYDKKTREKLSEVSYVGKNIEQENNKKLYNELTKGLDDVDFPDGFYLSDGVYLHPDGTMTSED